ncbi:hypothetical protein GGI07_000738 [Coemansia sp. Benny D115]|nr:hypothetical protein GGI07_000738 [Coemansia sp. Benny D115]
MSFQQQYPHPSNTHSYHTQQEQQQQQPESSYNTASHNIHPASSSAAGLGTDDQRRRRKSSAYAMHVDAPSSQQQQPYHHPSQQQQQHQQQQLNSAQPLPAAQSDYFSYATTTAHMIDPWAFNHATLLANLSQLPPDLLPSLLPQISQIQQQQPSSIMTTTNMSALAAAAAVAAAAAAAGAPLGSVNQQQQPMQVDHSFAVPAIPNIHQQQQQQQQHSHSQLPNTAQFPALQQQHPSQPLQTASAQPQGGYSQNIYYGAASSLQPLMVPPPSPTVLSYYTADPNHWMSLLGQNAYQPQAYHYDYPTSLPSALGPAASLHYNSSNGANNPSAAASAFTQLPSGHHHHIPPHQHQQQQQITQSVDTLYQPARRSSSFTNLALLQQQQQQPQGQSSFVQPDLNSQYAPQASLLGNTGMMSVLQQRQNQQAQIQTQIFGATDASLSSGAYPSSSSTLFGSTNNSRLHTLNGSRSHGGLSSGARIPLSHKTPHQHHQQLQLQQQLQQQMAYPGQHQDGVTLFGAGIKPAHQLIQHTGDFIPGTRITRQQALDENVRDHVLQTAHQMYSNNARSPVLIEMLLCLHHLHPRHLPTLLLLACAYFSCGQAKKSLEYNEAILKIDSNYVEAMSNIGTTLRSMGRSAEAESWWWRAVKLRPGYWDAVENLMGVLCGPNKSADKGDGKSGSNSAAAAAARSGPRYKEALQLCEYVDNSLRLSDSPARYQVQEKQLPRLQSLLYSEGNLRLALGDVSGGRREYEKAMDVVLGGQQRIEDVVVRIACVGAQEGINQMFQAQQGHQPAPPSSFEFTSLPLTLLTPENAVRVPQVLFPQTHGVLPGFASLGATQLQQANQVAANLLLALAKLYQDHALVPQPLTVVLPLYYLALALAPSPSTCNNLGIILSAIPSPPTPTLVPSLQGGHQAAQAPMGAALALQFYTHGLGLDARHPHLYTNLGSLLKDLGYVAEAVRMYEKAVEVNPTFDVALANLGNAIKDMGRVQDSVSWYLRAVTASPNFVEAVCGLANAMAGVCDWRARDGLWTEVSIRWHAAALGSSDMSDRIFMVMSSGRRPTAPAVVTKMQRLLNYAPAPSPPASKADGAAGAIDKRRGWMNRVVEIVDQQLYDGKEWCRGLLLVRSEGCNLLRPTRALVWFLDGLSRLVPEDSGLALATTIHGALELAKAVASAGESADKLPGDTRRKWTHVTRQMRNEGGWALRLVERVVVVQQRRLYHEVLASGGGGQGAGSMGVSNNGPAYRRPQLPTGMAAPHVPTVLPFHTFTYPLDAREVRLISHRNALRLSFSTLGGGAPWLPAQVFPPPPAPAHRLHIGYVSSDFNNHPLAHLMQSVFGMHDRSKYRIYCYATTPPDGSTHRTKIEAEADVFVACSAWSTQRIVERIAADGIHVLVNLNGYTKGARNEIFAARPAPVLVAFMGFAGTLGAGWCDYVVTDPIVCPPWTVRSEVRAERQLRARGPEMAERSAMSPGGTNSSNSSNGVIAGSGEPSTSEESQQQQQQQRRRDWVAALGCDFGELDPEEEDPEDGDFSDPAGTGGWVYTERMIYMPHTYFVNDHRQGFREDDELRGFQRTPDELWLAEQDARYCMRRELFPQLSDDVYIFANFNQLYKIDPLLFRLWLRVLERAPNSIIWLLRFPAAGEEHLRRVAVEWAGEEVASRVVFTDVAPKHMHIKRGRIADAFLDTTECNAHTTAVDILWSGTPVLTWPRHEHKLCSRVAASVVCATGHGRRMVVSSADEYVDRAVEWATRASHEYMYAYPAADKPSILEADAQTGLVKHRLCHGPAMDIRKELFMSRDQSRLFDTLRWTRNLERGLSEAWRRWVSGEDEAASSSSMYNSSSSSSSNCDGGSSFRQTDPTSGAGTGHHHKQLSVADQRRMAWGQRVEREMREAFASNPESTVYAPPGRSIWVRDADDNMPAHTWMCEMMEW